MSYRHLPRDERNVIYTMQVQGYPPAEIARCLGRHRSTIGRECKRNADVRRPLLCRRGPDVGQRPKTGSSPSAQDRGSSPDGAMSASVCRTTGRRSRSPGDCRTSPGGPGGPFDEPYHHLSLDLERSGTDPGSSVPSCGSPESPGVSPMANPPATARSPANDPLRSGPDKPTTDSGSATGKAIRSSAKAARDSF